MSAEIQQVDERPDYFGFVVKSLPCTFLLLAFWNEVLHNLLQKFQAFSTEKWVKL